MSEPPTGGEEPPIIFLHAVNRRYRQGAATLEISRNVQHAATGSSKVAERIAAVSRGASETGSASDQVLTSAQILSRESARLKAEVGKFLAAVRAA